MSAPAMLRGMCICLFPLIPSLPLPLLLCPSPACCCAAEEGRKAAFAVRGHKLALAAARHYVVAVLADGEAAAAGTSGQQVGAAMPQCCSVAAGAGAGD